MELGTRNISISELKSENRILRFVIAGLTLALVFISVKHAFQTEIVVMQTPGMPNNSVIAKSSMDKEAQIATLYAFTNNLSQVNPANVEYIKLFIQAYLAPAAYTKISKEIDDHAAKLASQRELGSYYFVLRGYDYDDVLDKHFVKGDVHVVNAAKDSATPYIFEYKTHIENYRLVIDDVKTYEGDRIHNSEWLKSVKKPQ
jgi:conjugal transfer pilus assembly protein TraE